MINHASILLVIHLNFTEVYDGLTFSHRHVLEQPFTPITVQNFTQMFAVKKKTQLQTAARTATCNLSLSISAIQKLL